MAAGEAPSCVFAKALWSGAPGCECARRGIEGERMRIGCAVPTSHANCALLADLVHERARFALRLAVGAPLTHAQALRLQSGALAALATVLDDPGDDVHRRVVMAQQRFGSLAELPWSELVAALAAWRPPARRRSPP